MLAFIYAFLLVFIAVNQINAVPLNETDTWNGKWFPGNPYKKTTSNETDSWNGKWFPGNYTFNDTTSKKTDLQELFDATKTETNTKESWKGKWFPSKPNGKINPSNIQNTINVESTCDDGKTNIDVDFDPENQRHSYNYLCFSRKSKYEPSYATSPIQREYLVPPTFKAPSYCQNETIEYEDPLPTFGAHRYLYPKYGEYIFLPPQRWMHNLEYGSVVMLYHPCANKMQIDQLRGALNACVYRHIITPSRLLLPERPLALVVWGKSLEMSVVDVSTVTDFIKNNAKKGPKTGEPEVQIYDAGLIAESKLVTDQSDSEVCANINNDVKYYF